MPKPQEIAVLIVAGQKFDDWESVFVHERPGDSFAYFNFTAAERDTAITTAAGKVPLWQRLQFKPDDPCQITLAGIPVINGYIETRQVAYDANQHGVQLIGKSLTAWPARSSVDTKTGNFDNKNVKQIAEQLITPFGVKIKTIGVLDNEPFPKLQNQPGELIWDFLERICRTKGIVLGSDAQGNFLLIGEHTFPVLSDLVEGQNIKACQCIISKQHAYTEFNVDSQTPANNKTNGTAASEVRGKAAGTQTNPRSVLITPGEHPMNQPQADKRADYESIWHKGTIIKANITVQGWLRDGKSLWKPLDNVHVYSPMAMLNQVMKIKDVQFTQDNASGTQTRLELVWPGTLRDQNNWDLSKTDDVAAQPPQTTEA
jgi:prophage tail gpP-like protein